MASNSRPVWLTAVAPLVVVSGVSALTSSAHGQSLIVPDATLGNEPSQVVNASEINGLPSELVTGGAQRGPNLFHSFLEFNIAEGRQVYFANPAGIDNIFSRITGSNPSEIFGTLGVDGEANLFLLNPNGLTFGPNAQLDIEGSFLASTAEAITFEEGDEFSAVAPQTAPLLTVSVPLGLQHGASSTGATIANEGNLSVGQNLTLAADQLNLQGQLWAGGDLTLMGTDTLEIRDASDSPFIAASRGNLLAQGNEQVDIFALNHPDSGLFAGGNLVLRSANAIAGDAHYRTSGNFYVEQLDESPGNLTSTYTSIISSFGNVLIHEYNGSSLHILTGGSASISTSTIRSPEKELTNIIFSQGATIASDGTIIEIDGKNRPTLDIRSGLSRNAIIQSMRLASDTLENFFIEDLSSMPALLNADIVIGDVQIRSPNGLVFLTNQYGIQDDSENGSIFITGEGRFGSGIDLRDFVDAGGEIFLDSRDNIYIIRSIIITVALDSAGDIVLIAGGLIHFDGIIDPLVKPANASIGSPSGAFSGVFGGDDLNSTAQSGNIRIQAANLLLTNGSQLSTDVISGNGNAGSIIITVSESVHFDGFDILGFPSAAFANFRSDGEGNGGDIRITSENLEITDGAQIGAAAFGGGNGGTVVLEISDSIRVEGSIRGNEGMPTRSGVFSSIQPDGEGQGGDVLIRTTNLEVLGGAIISARNAGFGNAGNVLIELTGKGILSGVSNIDNRPSGIFTDSQNSEGGAGGNIYIGAIDLIVDSDASISAASEGSSGSGNILLNIGDLFLAYNGTVQTSSETGSGGQIFLNAASVRLYENSDIQTSVRLGEGSGGDINIIADSILAFGDSDILAFAQEGQGGNITLNTRAFFGENYQPSPEGIDPFTLDGNGRVDINASGAISGVVTIPDVSFIENSLTALPDTVVDTDQLIAGSCIARTDTGGSFIVSGRGGLPDRPSDTFTAPYSTGSVLPLPADGAAAVEDDSTASWQPGDSIVEPEGLFQLPDGRVVISQRCEAE